MNGRRPDRVVDPEGVEHHDGDHHPSECQRRLPDSGVRRARAVARFAIGVAAMTESSENTRW
jgi:hypothetical protein